MAIKIAGTEVINDNKELVLAKLTEINTTIADTAVDVFVYDTSKDSDGGAWRKRTQGTSWYNETLNTATRGSRKEFPAVAVIVAEADTVTIYDGDDPSLPMWMVFNISNNIGSCAVANGMITLGMTTTGVIMINFPSVELLRIISSGLQSATWSNTFAGSAFATFDASVGIVNNAVNDVAMTVLPNAPIDSATGLPVPTIAVATDGGVSVIKDDGNVFDLTYLLGGVDSELVEFDGKGGIYWGGYSPFSNASIYLYWNKTLPTADDNSTPDAIYASNENAVADLITKKGNFGYNSLSISEIIAAGASNGLFLIDQKDDSLADGMTLQMTSSFNTGWMNGDIKLATLSDTDDTDVSGSELVTNGTFDTDTSGWSAGASSTITYSSGVARLQLTGGSIGDYPKARTSLGTLTAGKKYTVSIGSYISVSGNNLRVKLNTDGGVSSDGQPDGTLYYNSATTITNFSFTFEADSSSEHFLWMYLRDTTGDSEATFDNISVRLAEEDRSANGNGLQVFGTVTKNPVATGADLMAYSGWALTNYLKQPPNADLTVNSDRTFVCWFKTSYTGNYSYLFSLSGSTVFYGLGVNITNGYLYAYDNINNIDTTSTAVADGNWHCAAMVHAGGYKRLYVDGKLAGTFAVSDVTIDSDANFYLGVYYNGTNLDYNFSGGSLALARFSHTVPSPEQIAKIYEDEKVLFQENAQATLYGSSDAVTALAYDDTTELLHVGTSAGRSDFQGLRRVNNTTNAVGAAISASNGMIVEE